MRLIQSVGEINTFRESWSKQGVKWGLTPTMGYLHEGHLSLVRQARAENEKVVVSIFVNPLQFGPKEDLSRYPQNLERDLNLLKKEGVDFVFNPLPEEMYPPNYATFIEVGNLTNQLEGAERPGHFKGVATVVAKLFNLTGAQKAYFGQKDAQQTLVIKRMVRDLNLPIEIRVCPTIREKDGLAMSSRNVYLSPEERQAAPVLFKALSQAAELWKENPNQRNGPGLRKRMLETLKETALAQVNYASAADPESLLEYSGSISPGKGVLLSLAVRFGQTRLIDNFLLEG